MDHFILHSEYQPTGDQPEAIDALVKGFEECDHFHTLLYLNVTWNNML